MNDEPSVRDVLRLMGVAISLRVQAAWIWIADLATHRADAWRRRANRLRWKMGR